MEGHHLIKAAPGHHALLKLHEPANGRQGRAHGLTHGRRIRGLVVGLLGLLLAAVAPAQAQYSPNCRLNGQPVCCSLTPVAPLRAGEPEALTVVFADHRAIRLQQQPASCRNTGPLTRCEATLTPDNGMGTPLRGHYEGLAYEGGYRHRWIGRELSLEFVFLD